MGGRGGNGGNGGNGGDGSTIFYVGPDRVVDFLEFTIVDNPKGLGGLGGATGRNGSSGPGGARGEHRGNCGGGDSGATPPSRNDRVLPGANGADGQQGLIYSSRNFDVNSLF